MGAKVHVIVLNWNGWADTSSCLSSLEHLNYQPYQVIVVDNGSTDDSASRLRRQFPALELIETGKNLGFAGGCNVGIRQALDQGADFIWLLNNDTTVDPGALQALVDKARENQRIGAVGSAIYFMDEPQRIQAWGGGYINLWLGRSEHFLKRISDRQIQFLTGASLLLSRPALQAVGMLDEGFFMYWEDADFCFRLRRAGLQLAVAGRSIVWHKGSDDLGEGERSVPTSTSMPPPHASLESTPLCRFFLSGWGLLCGLRKEYSWEDWERTRAVWAGMTQGRVAP